MIELWICNIVKLGFVNFVGYFCGLRFFCETSEGFCSFQEAESL